MPFTRLALSLALLVCALPAQEIDFEKHVRPILQKSCYKCHGAKRQKGKLRLDQWSESLTTGEHPALVAGKPDDSELLRRVILPADDPDVMPQSGDPLSAEDIATLRKWLAEGAKWPKGSAPDDPDARWNKQFEIGDLTEEQQASQKQAIGAVRKIGGLAGRIANNTAAVDVNLSLIGKDIKDEQLDALSGLEPSLVWLNLSRTAITDAGLKQVGGLKRLRRLHLARTAIGDAGLENLSSLTGLHFLNLYGTNVTDAGLEHLAGMKDLQKLFLWQTKVTDDGVAKLKKQLPGVLVDQGRYEKPAAVKVETKKMPVNKKCPITGKDVDGTFTATFEDQVVALCCKNCLASFKKNPEKFIAKVDGFKRKPVNAKCPVTGKDVDAKHTVVHAGKVVAFCCPNCKAAFEKNPAKFAAKLK